MADTVRYMMEGMIPELEDFQKRGYFSKQELNEIVRKRENFEYLLKRRAARKEDFLGYVEYEQKLEQLRVLRKRKLRIKGKKTMADHAIVKRVHFIFQRAARKFKSDLQLWLRWLDFCKQTDSGKLFSKVATRALRLHPHCAALWSLAAAWEFEHNGNASAARLLMQQGLRMCKHEPALWVEYFNMELKYVRKLRARRKVLGLDVPGKKTALVSEQDITEAGKSVPDIPLEEEPTVAAEPGTVASDNSEAAAAVEAVLKGAVAMVVLRNALTTITGNLAMRQQLLDVARDFKFPGMKAIRETIYQSVAVEFTKVEDAWDLLARRHSHEEASISSSDLDSCCSVYEEALQCLPSSKMFQLYACFLHHILDAKMDSPDEVESAAAVAKKLLSLFKRAHHAGAATPDLYLQWNTVAQQIKQPKMSLNALRLGCERHPSNSHLWTARLQLEATAAGLSRNATQDRAATAGLTATGQEKAHGGDKSGQDKTQGEREDVDVHVNGAHGGVAAELQGAVRQALGSVGAHQGASVWKQALQLMGSSRENTEQLQQLLLTTLMSCSKGPVRGGLGEVAGLFLSSLCEHEGIKAAREFFGKLNKVPCAGADMFHAMLDLEESALAESSTPKSGESKHIKLVFEAAVSAYGDVDTDLWIRYASWTLSTGVGNGDVYWRATKALVQPEDFVDKYRQLQQL